MPQKGFWVLPQLTAEVFTITKTPISRYMDKKTWYIYTMESYLVRKKSDIMTRSGKWMRLQIVMWSKTSQIHKEILHVFFCIWILDFNYMYMCVCARSCTCVCGGEWVHVMKLEGEPWKWKKVLGRRDETKSNRYIWLESWGGGTGTTKTKNVCNAMIKPSTATLFSKILKVLFMVLNTRAGISES